VALVLEAVVDLEERHDPLVLPEVLGGALPPDRALHRHLEQDRPEDPVAGEGGARHDARAHGVNQVEHLRLVGVRRLRDAIEPQGTRRAAAALVERRDEPVAVPHPLELLLVHDAPS